MNSGTALWSTPVASAAGSRTLEAGPDSHLGLSPFPQMMIQVEGQQKTLVHAISSLSQAWPYCLGPGPAPESYLCCHPQLPWGVPEPAPAEPAPRRPVQATGRRPRVRPPAAARPGLRECASSGVRACLPVRCDLLPLSRSISPFIEVLLRFPLLSLTWAVYIFFISPLAVCHPINNLTFS